MSLVQMKVVRRQRNVTATILIDNFDSAVYRKCYGGFVSNCRRNQSAEGQLILGTTGFCNWLSTYWPEIKTRSPSSPSPSPCHRHYYYNKHRNFLFFFCLIFCLLFFLIAVVVILLLLVFLFSSSSSFHNEYNATMCSWYETA